MGETRKLKIGLVGVMCTPFRGDKESQYSASGDALQKLAQQLSFDLNVIPDGIYSVDDAQQAAAALQAWEVDFILVQTSSFAAGDFIYPFTDLDSYLGLWAVPEGLPTSEGGLPLNSFTAMNLYNSIIKTRLAESKKTVKWFYGRPGQPLFDQRLAITVRALTAVVNLQGARVGIIGGVAPSFDNLRINEETLLERLGVQVAHFTFEEVLRLANEQYSEEVKEAAADIAATAAKIAAEQDIALQKSGRMQLAYQSLAEEYALDALAVSCWPQFQEDYHFAVCAVMGYMNDLGLVAACEGDIPSAVSMLALRYMSRDKTLTLMDLVSMDETDESVLLWHCGPTAPSLADSSGVEMQPLWLFDGYEGDPIGLQNNLVMKPGSVTVMGFTPDFARLMVMNGKIDNQKPSYIGSRGWLTDIRLNGDLIHIPDLIQTLMASGFQHHYPVVYDNLVDESLELAAWLGIKPIKKQPYTPYLQV